MASLFRHCPKQIYSTCSSPRSLDQPRLQLRRHQLLEWLLEWWPRSTSWWAPGCHHLATPRFQTIHLIHLWKVHWAIDHNIHEMKCCLVTPQMRISRIHTLLLPICLHPQHGLARHLQVFEEKDFYNINEVADISSKKMSEEFGLTAGNAYFFLDAIRKEMKCIDHAMRKGKLRRY